MKTICALMICLSMPLSAAEKAAPKQEQKEPVVNVGGQVKRPGPVAFRGNMTLLAAIFAAGGVTEFGTMRRVKVIRGGKTLEFDLTNEKQKAETRVNPDDTVEVPAKNIFGR